MMKSMILSLSICNHHLLLEANRVLVIQRIIEAMLTKIQITKIQILNDERAAIDMDEKNPNDPNNPNNERKKMKD